MSGDETVCNNGVEPPWGGPGDLPGQRVGGRFVTDAVDALGSAFTTAEVWGEVVSAHLASAATSGVAW